MRMRVSLALSSLMALLVALPAAAQPPLAVFNGTIASGPQYDLYTVNLIEGYTITTTLVCDEIAPGDRPLDPVLSVFYPGVDPSDVANANHYNDDGFGSDDDPFGVDCNAFDSSRIIFVVPANGAYTFRADGFGSSVGPYTLTIRGVLNVPVPATGPLALLVLAGLLLLLFAWHQRRRAGVVRR